MLGKSSFPTEGNDIPIDACGLRCGGRFIGRAQWKSFLSSAHLNTTGQGTTATCIGIKFTRLLPMSGIGLSDNSSSHFPDTF